MRILSLELTDYRNYARAELRPCAGVTVLAGDNAQGKTNLLEAVYLSCTGRSHRTRQDRELVRWGADFCRVCVAVSYTHLDVYKRQRMVSVEACEPQLPPAPISMGMQAVSTTPKAEVLSCLLYTSRCV